MRDDNEPALALGRCACGADDAAESLPTAASRVLVLVVEL